MNRNSLLETSGRAMHFAVRMTLDKADDNPMMQTLNFAGMNSEGRKEVERVQGFGFSSMPLPREESEGKQESGASGGGIGGSGEQPKGAAAEGIALFLGGQRNHPVVIAVDDRRHRPMGLKAGENAQYDDQGQMTLIRRTGMYVVSLDDDGSGQQPGAKMLKDADGRATGKSEKQERMVSLRHVEKKKQDRSSGGQSGGQAGGQTVGALAAAAGAQNPKKEDYKHEGETVNTEVRCTKNRIEFRAGDKVVGYYDVQQDQWHFSAKTILNEATDQIKDKAPKIDHN